MSAVRVVGAGVIGLSCAIRLLERGHRVAVVAGERPEQTTSAVAGGLWYPYLAAPVDRVTAWGDATLLELRQLADASPDAGIALAHGTEQIRDEVPDPGWIRHLSDFARGEPLPGYRAAWSFTSPIVDMGTYLSWLLARVRDLGGAVEWRHLSALPDDGVATVVACGLGAESLLGDTSMDPVRGQVIVVEQFGLREWSLDSAGCTYVIPRAHDIVVGGTEAHGERDLVPDEAVAADIWRRATRLVPELEGARVLRHKVGLRPGRPTVRLEPGAAGATPVVYCYGHGGAGVTLSWGCADEVADLVDSL